MSRETELHTMLRESIQELSDAFDWSYWRPHLERNEFPTESWNELADAGWLGVAIPEQYGGEGLGMYEMTTIIEELTRGGWWGALLFYFLGPLFGGVAIQSHGTEAQKETYLPGIASGETRFCLGVTEARAGVNTLNVDTNAHRDGDEFVIDGQKMFISGVDTADHMLLISSTSAGPGEQSPDGLSLFVIRDINDRDSVAITPVETRVPWFEEQFQVDLNGVVVPEDAIVGEEGTGLALLWDTLNTERIATSAAVIGGGLRAVDRAVEYANARDVFDGKPIGQYQGIQHPLADAYSKLVASRSVMYDAAEKWDRGEDCGTEANIAKLRSSEAGLEATDMAIQTHGGNGFTPEYEVHYIWENVRLSKTAPIPNEMIKNFIAENALGLPPSY